VCFLRKAKAQWLPIGNQISRHEKNLSIVFECLQKVLCEVCGGLMVTITTTVKKVRRKVSAKVVFGVLLIWFILGVLAFSRDLFALLSYVVSFILFNILGWLFLGD